MTRLPQIAISKFGNIRQDDDHGFMIDDFEFTCDEQIAWDSPVVLLACYQAVINELQNKLNRHYEKLFAIMNEFGESGQQVH